MLCILNLDSGSWMTYENWTITLKLAGTVLRTTADAVTAAATAFSSFSFLSFLSFFSGFALTTGEDGSKQGKSSEVENWTDKIHTSFTFANFFNLIFSFYQAIFGEYEQKVTKVGVKW